MLGRPPRVAKLGGSTPVDSWLAANASVSEPQGDAEVLVLRAPADGHVVSVHLQTGGVTGPREPVATVVGQSGGRVVACLAESSALDVRVGEKSLLDDVITDLETNARRARRG